MKYLSKEQFDKILSDANSNGYAIMDRILAINCMKQHYNIEAPFRFIHSKAELVGIFKDGENVQLIRLPLRRWQVKMAVESGGGK